MGLEFINITESEFLSNKLLHKYMPLEYALEMLNNKHLWFANPAIWKDPFEKKFVDANFKDRKTSKIVRFPWANRVFCLCLTQTATSEAYWNTYIRANIGIAFKFNRAALLDALKAHSGKYGIYIGKVEYMKTSSINKTISNIPFSPAIAHNLSDPRFNARLLLLKRNAYKYEDEIRVIVVKDKSTTEQGIYLPYADNTTLIDSLSLDPMVGPQTTALLKNIFENMYGFSPIKTTKGIRYRVQKSQLYTQLSPQTIKI